MTNWKSPRSYIFLRNQTARRSYIRMVDQKTNMDFSGMNSRNTSQQKGIPILRQIIAARQATVKSMNGPTTMIGALATHKIVCMGRSFCAVSKISARIRLGLEAEVMGGT